MTSGLNAADIDYDILIFIDQENTRGSIIAADIDLEKSQRLFFGSVENFTDS